MNLLHDRKRIKIIIVSRVRGRDTSPRTVHPAQGRRRQCGYRRRSVGIGARGRPSPSLADFAKCRRPVKLVRRRRRRRDRA